MTTKVANKVRAKRVKTYNFKLDEDVSDLLDRMSALVVDPDPRGERSRVLRESILLAAHALEAARKLWIAHAEVLRERLGSEGRLIVVVEEEDGEPQARLIVNGEDRDDLHAIPVLAGDEVQVYLVIPGLTPGLENMVIGNVGDAAFLTTAQLPIGRLPWPPDPRVGLVIKVAQLQEILDLDPAYREAVEV